MSVGKIVVEDVLNFVGEGIDAWVSEQMGPRYATRIAFVDLGAEREYYH